MSYEKQNFVDNQILTADNLNHIENGIEQLEQNKADKLVYSDEASYTFNMNELEIIGEEHDVCYYNVKGLIRVIPNKSINISIAKKDGSVESLSTTKAIEDTMPSGNPINIAMAISEDYSKYIQIMTNSCIDNNDTDGNLTYDPLNNIIVIKHPDIDNIESFTITTSGEFKIDDEKVFDDRYQLVNKFEKNYWDNKVDKEYVDTLAANAAIMNVAHIEEIDALIEDNNINVLDYKYQRVEMFNNANIIFPEVSTFTEIHLFFDTTEDLTINLPACRKKQLPEILANKSYELVAIYNMNYWLVEINVFE